MTVLQMMTEKDLSLCAENALKLFYEFIIKRIASFDEIKFTIKIIIVVCIVNKDTKDNR